MLRTNILQNVPYLLRLLYAVPVARQSSKISFMSHDSRAKTESLTARKFVTSRYHAVTVVGTSAIRDPALHVLLASRSVADVAGRIQRLFATKATTSLPNAAVHARLRSTVGAMNVRSVVVQGRRKQLNVKLTNANFDHLEVTLVLSMKVLKLSMFAFAHVADC